MFLIENTGVNSERTMKTNAVFIDSQENTQRSFQRTNTISEKKLDALSNFIQNPSTVSSITSPGLTP